VDCVRIERHIGHDAHLGKALFHLADAARHETFRIERLLRAFAFQRRIDHREKRDRRNAQCERLLNDPQQLVHAASRNAGHRWHGLDGLSPFEDEDRQDQVFRCEARFAHQAAREIVAPGTAHAA